MTGHEGGGGLTRPWASECVALLAATVASGSPSALGVWVVAHVEPTVDAWSDFAVTLAQFSVQLLRARAVAQNNADDQTLYCPQFDDRTSPVERDAAQLIVMLLNRDAPGAAGLLVAVADRRGLEVLCGTLAVMARGQARVEAARAFGSLS